MMTQQTIHFRITKMVVKHSFEPLRELLVEELVIYIHVPNYINYCDNVIQTSIIILDFFRRAVLGRYSRRNALRWI